MKKVEILAVCSHPGILQTLLRLIDNNPGWNATGADNEQQALAYFNEKSFDIVLLGSGMDEVSEDRLRPACLAINPAVKIIRHYGGGSGLLSGEIYQALN
ncbi:response regulator receiver protein [Mucilaginibacter boryungensis]|uniref:Response regulator receiver protein n=1 Tax=Mucilaginibacter boryungensis TaxID=768480 RepID=A0ABR9XNB4_9SPHI|nr:response regulator receiver protein [Mucilaginibacter boryungensis]MBE9668500.1 response regulator receiver protein [Mucilaginibacter boryungensis]